MAKIKRSAKGRAKAPRLKRSRKADPYKLGRRHKYNVAPQTERYSAILGRTFHSAAERRYAEHLYARHLNHEITYPEFQVRVKLQDTILSVNMIVDFKYFDERLGEWVWDEFKGMETPSFRRQKKAWEQIGPGLYCVTKENRGDKIVPYRFEYIRPKAKKRGIT